MNSDRLSQLKVVEKYIFKSIEQISELLAHEDTAHTDDSNHFGDKQLKIDVLSDEIIFSNLRASKFVKFALSEEKPELHDMGGQEFIVTFDPLDGSSIIDVNWAVGTIYAVWPTDNDLIGQTPRQILTSGIALYGPRTTVVKYNAENQQVEEYTMKKLHNDTHYTWELTKGNIQIAGKTKIFAPANLRATSDNKHYEELFEFWRKNKYTLRYSGGLVPDVYQIFIRGNGVFSNPSSEVAPAKLRFLYEVAPVSFIIEKAGGRSTNGKISVLDIEVESYVMRNALCIGSSEEVARYERVIGSHI